MVSLPHQEVEQPFMNVRVKTARSLGTVDGVAGVLNNGNDQGLVVYNAERTDPFLLFYQSESAALPGGDLNIKQSKNESNCQLAKCHT